MAGRFLVLGGFEPSGHDGTAEAVIEAGRRRGLTVEYLRWRDQVDLASHSMFVSHRIAASRGMPELAGMLDDGWICEALSADLAHLIPAGFDAYIAIHPWSTMICANALSSRGDESARLVDYYAEFSQYPAVVHPRIDAYAGGGVARPLPPSVRRRCHSIGVAVPSRFHAESMPNPREDCLVVSVGSDGWVINAMAPATSALVKLLSPACVYLLAPTPAAAQAWREAAVGGNILEGLTDISPVLKASKWYLSKGGGTAVAEGLAAGCIGFVAASGVFWEDEAAWNLAAKGVVVAATAHMNTVAVNPVNAGEERHRTTGAAEALWHLVQDGDFVAPLHGERETLGFLLNRIDHDVSGVLPHTTRRLRERLLEWYEGTVG